ncbi:C39 family peptidase [Cytobacillus gottheilii]|uniref:C39 family peptidase n=1 Tax=Cytobacillus gottheilii TaxID=859144 RepID=UPI0024956F0B|nr:C39 family peptidase [Cytobacillus gottheilii]
MKIFLTLISLVAVSFSLIFFLAKGEVSKLLDLIFPENQQVDANDSGEMQPYDTTIIKIKDKVLLDAPIIKQFPELPRGCEVTSLAMLLQYKGIKADKMSLANQISKNSVPLKKENGRIFWGNPNEGFIGDMYSYNNPGYGVYHKPIKQLAEQFLPGKIKDLTGGEFTELQTFLSLDIPVWIITNTTYKKLPESAFEKWQTPGGEIKITYKEHSVLVTGYDEKVIYFNDPISGAKNKAIPKEDFLAAWKQMGSQAVTYLPD